MIELITTISITVASVAMFCYWFRYMCLMILNTKTSHDYATDFAMANQLSFLNVQNQLRETAGADLDRLQASLDRDYAVLARLMTTSTAGFGVEGRMLQLNYRIMHTWYSVSSRFSAQFARRALDEMSQVVSHFANSMGEAAMGASAA